MLSISSASSAPLRRFLNKEYAGVADRLSASCAAAQQVPAAIHGAIDQSLGGNGKSPAHDLPGFFSLDAPSAISF
jgi:hypothetical protein